MTRTPSTPDRRRSPGGARKLIAIKAWHNVYAYFMSLPKGERSQWVNQTLAYTLSRVKETEKR